MRGFQALSDGEQAGPVQPPLATTTVSNGRYRSWTSARLALELISGDDGSREPHPQASMEAIAQCFAQIDPQLRCGVRALAMSGQQRGLVMLDAGGNVLAPAKLRCDTSSPTTAPASSRK